MLRPAIPATLLLVLCLSSAAAAQRRITGRVVEEGSGAPLSSVSVTLPGTNVGAITGENGTFALMIPAGEVQLAARRIGYRRRAITVGAAQADVQVALERDPYRLEAQIVTGAATTVARQNLATDVGLVTADQLARVPSPSIENALAGKIAGAQVIANGGAPGGGNQIRLRGVTSVFGSADPLYVVDGVIISNDVIQPGTNALTSARRASSNASNQDNGVNRIADLNPNDIETVEVLKGASASAIYGSKASNGVILIKTKTGSAGAPISNVTQRLGTFDLARKFNLRRFNSLAEAQAYAAAQGYAMTPAEVAANYTSCNGFCDFEEQLYGENPLSYETGLAVRGGTGSTNYFVSGLTKYDGGIQKNTGYKKDAIRLNLSQFIGDKLSLQVNNNYIRTLTRRGISNNDNANITPYFVFAATPSWFDMRPKDGVYPVTPVMGTNTFQNVDFIQTPDEVNRIISSASASYQILNGERQTLALRVDGGLDRFNEQVNIVSPGFLIFEPNDGLPGTVTSNSGSVMNLNLNVSLAHSYTPAGRGFTATTAAGIQRETSALRNTNVVTRDVLPGLENINSGSAPEVFANREEVRGFAMFAQEEFLAMNEKLLLTAGVRAERNTRNGDVEKLYAFPKASVSYRLVDAIPKLGEVKLRLAVGQSGNQPLYLQKYRTSITGVYDRQNAVQAGPSFGDPGIKPERQTEIETGFDAQFGGRGSLAFTLYQKTIDDVILQIAAAPSVGYTVQILNGGQFRNRGVEALLDFTPIQRADYAWTSRTTFAKNVGIVTALPVPSFTLSQDATGQGVAFGAGYGIARLEVGESVTQIVASDGANGVVKKGDASPTFTMGFSNELMWKGLRLSSLFDWQKGGNLVNVTKNVFDAFGLAPDVADGGLERINLNDTQGIAQYVEDASFVKLREIAIGYELPPSWYSRLGGRTRSVRLELSGRNLYTWTKYTGADPEVSNFGNQQISRFIDLAPFPPSRSIFFTVDVGF